MHERAAKRRVGLLDAVDNLGELAGILTRFVLPFVIVVLGLSIAGGNQARASKLATLALARFAPQRSGRSAPEQQVLGFHFVSAPSPLTPPLSPPCALVPGWMCTTETNVTRFAPGSVGTS